MAQEGLKIHEVEPEDLSKSQERHVDARPFSQDEWKEEQERQKIDVDQYIGREVKIADIEERSKTFKGGRISWYVKFIAEPVDHLDNGIELRPSKIIGLTQIERDGKKELGWEPGGKMANFLERIGVQHYRQAPGRTVKVTTTEGKDGKRYLSF